MPTPITVSAFGEMRVSVRPCTMRSRSQPQPRPKALVQVIAFPCYGSATAAVPVSGAPSPASS